MTMPKILFVGEAVSLAHVGRPSILARWAQEAGYNVSFACGARFAQVACAEGFAPKELITIAPEVFYGRLAQGKFFYTKDELLGYVEAERAILRRVRPDIVVADFRLSVAISAELEGIPMLSLTQAHWSPAAGEPVPAPLHWPAPFLPRAIRHALFDFGRALAYRYFAAPLDAVRQGFGMPPRRDFRLNYTDGDYCAYLDLPELSPLEGLPRGHFFLGPLSWTPIDISPNLFVDRPVAYVSMGSSGDERLVPNVLRALADAGYYIALSGIRPPVVPENSAVTYLGTADPAPILDRAELTVCHGGAGTVYQSLAAGVPVLSLPSNPDQELMARAVKRIDAGICLPAELATVRTLRQAVEETVSEVCRESASRMALAIGTHNTRSRWLAWLERTLNPTAKAHRLSRSVERTRPQVEAITVLA